MTTPRSEFFAGVRAELPLQVGVVPFGFIYGALAVQLGVPASIAQAMSSVIFGGSSQFIAAPLIVAQTPALILIATVFFVNLRHALYSASLAPYLEKLSARWKMLLAYLLTDEAYAVAIARFQPHPLTPSPETAAGEGDKRYPLTPCPETAAGEGDKRYPLTPCPETAAGEGDKRYPLTPSPETAAGEGDKRHWFLFGAGITLWSFWQASTAVGIFVGAQVPPEWSLDFALPLTFIAIVLPMLRNRAYVLCAIVAAIGGVLAFGLPYKLGYIVAAMVAIAFGFILETRWTHR